MCALRTQQHDCGGAGALVPALPDVGAVRLLAHRVELQRAQRLRQVLVALLRAQDKGVMNDIE